MSQYEKHFDQIDDRFAKLDSQVAELKTDVAELKTDVAELKTDMSEVQGTLAFLVEHAIESEKRQERHLEIILEQFRSDMRAYREESRGHGKRLNDLERRVTDLEDAC